MEDKLEKIISEERAYLNLLYGELSNLGGGTLNKRIRGNRYYFMERLDGKQVGITGNQGKIYRLARKGYLAKKVELCEATVRIVEKALTGIKAIEREKNEALLIKKFNMLDSRRVIYSDEEIRWLNNRQSKNPYMKEHLIFGTNEGVLMRSKSERFIGNFVESKGLIYMYEPQVVIKGKPVYPDFMIRCSGGRVVLWEHCGLMNDREYFSKTMEKLYRYRESGYVLHENLICTFEEDLVNIENLEKIYRRFLMD